MKEDFFFAWIQFSDLNVQKKQPVLELFIQCTAFKATHLSQVRLRLNRAGLQISQQFSELSWCCYTLWYSQYLHSVISLFAQRAASHLLSQLSPADATTQRPLGPFSLFLGTFIKWAFYFILFAACLFSSNTMLQQKRRLQHCLGVPCVLDIFFARSNGSQNINVIFCLCQLSNGYSVA